MAAAVDITAPTSSAEQLPREFQQKSLRHRAAQALIALTVLFGVVLFAPGLDEVRDKLGGASPVWLVAAAALEGLSFVSYIVMFGPIFCTGLTWRRSWEVGGSELAMGSLVPASGAGGLALGAWVLHRGGMDGERIARRSVAFFLIKSGVNFLAVALIGTALAVGLLGPDQPLWLTALPAALAALAIAVAAVLPRLGSSERLVSESMAAQSISTVLAGSVGFWAFDNAVLWATFHAVGVSPPITVVLMGYLIGQLGGLLPFPGGIGGIDLGLIGVLIAYGAPAAATAAAVFGYHLILFWLPLIVGGIAFLRLRRDMPGGTEFTACAPAIAIQTLD